MLKTFKFWIVILAIGGTLWAISPSKEQKMVSKQLEFNRNKDFIPYLSIPAPKESIPSSAYNEAKLWAGIVGQIMGGVGGLGVIVKSLSSLRKRKNGEQ